MSTGGPFGLGAAAGRPEPAPIALAGGGEDGRSGGDVVAAAAGSAVLGVAGTALGIGATAVDAGATGPADSTRSPAHPPRVATATKQPPAVTTRANIQPH
jgi:hypothetical protein